MSEEIDEGGLLESTARSFLPYPFLFKSWMRASDAKLVTDGEKIIAVNEEVVATFGYHPSELLGKSVDMLLPESVRDRHRDFREGYMRHPVIRPMFAGGVLKARHKNGTEFSVVINLLYYTDAKETLVEATVRRVDD